MLRAIVWWITGDAKRATTIAARVGQVIAFGMIVLGVMRFFGGAGFNGLWIAFIGWFLFNASRESYAQVALTDALRGVRVADVMSPDYASVDGHSNVQTFVEEHSVRTGRRCFVVTFNGQAEGLITKLIRSNSTCAMALHDSRGFDATFESGSHGCAEHTCQRST